MGIGEQSRNLYDFDIVIMLCREKSADCTGSSIPSEFRPRGSMYICR